MLTAVHEKNDGIACQVSVNCCHIFTILRQKTSKTPKIFRDVRNVLTADTTGKRRGFAASEPRCFLRNRKDSSLRGPQGVGGFGFVGRPRLRNVESDVWKFYTTGAVG